MSEEQPLREQVMQALCSVQDPELHQDLVTLGMIGEVDASPEAVRVKVILTTPACPLKNVIGGDVEAAVKTVAPDAEVTVEYGSRVQEAKRGAPTGTSELLPQVRNVVLVASGKGGVGKSTVAANLAVALAATGAKVGLMDADIHGPSMPIMMGIEGFPVEPNDDKSFDPVEVHGIKLMSMGFFLPPDQAVIWRGPMMSSAIVQFARDCRWGELDYLFLDLPPGTGDVQLTVSQDLDVSGAVIVSTPQDVALADVIRAQSMFEKVEIPILGVIENMSYFVCDGCGKRHEVFGHGGAEAVAKRMGLKFLGSLPIEPSLRDTSDSGVPQVLALPDSDVTATFRRMAEEVAARISVLAHTRAAETPGEAPH
jgi:ATP-binding protein involved in chromosome partitioning